MELKSVVSQRLFYMTYVSYGVYKLFMPVPTPYRCDVSIFNRLQKRRRFYVDEYDIQ